ncbi:hypothetical protein L218DRAFT_1038183, partial [Marasmius fiardii PR-910]
MSSPLSEYYTQLLGPYLLGYLLNYGLHGILTVQIYIYYNAFPNDNTAVQAIVYGVYAMEMTQTIMITWDAFHLFAFGFGNMETLLDAGGLFTWLDCFFIDGAVAFVAQTFFAYRIYLLSKSKPLTEVIIAMAVLQFGCSITAGAIMKIKRVNFGTVVQNILSFVATSVWLGGSAICDIVIAVSMTRVTSKHDLQFQKTKSLVKRIVRLTVGTGSLTGK